MGTHTQKTLTVMFTDIAGFTRHTGTVSRDAMMARLDRHNALLLPIVAHFDGRIVKSIGDALLVLFESPTNALQCGMLMQHRLAAHNAQAQPEARIEIKVSINTGEVALTADDVFGDPVNVAAKIEKATQPGEVYFTEATFLAMNRAEVPNAFVKTFRPRGADSDEIKLYKVVQDLDDPVYRHVVEGTVIDEAAMRTKTAALATAAEREAARWHDALANLAAVQHRSTRAVVTAVAVGVAVLAGAVVVALTLRRDGAAADPERALVADTRAYLAAGRTDEARRLVDAWEREHGGSTGVAAVRREIAESACAAACTKARALLAEGKDVEAAAAITTGEDPATMPAAAKALLARAQALGRARERLAAGDAAGARAAATAAAGDEPATGAVAAVVARADALVAARKALGVPEAERAGRSLEAIAALSQAYGDDTGDAAALGLLGEALAWNLGGVARTEGRPAALARLDETRRRFVHLTAWDGIRREVDLQSLWRYAEDPALHGRWGRWEHDDLIALLASLRAVAAKDAGFAYRLGATMAQVTARENLALTLGMDELDQAMRLDPKALDGHEDQVLAFATDWLGYDQPDGSFGRRVVAERFFDRLKPTLVAGVWAVRGEGADATPDVARRANSVAILAAKGDLAAVGDAVRWIDEALPIWIEGGDAPALSLDVATRLFATLDTDGHARLLRMLRDEADEARSKEGRFAVYGEAPAVLDRLRARLEATPPTGGR